jgi:hypothetical protein
VGETAVEVLARQARAYPEGTGETSESEPRVVTETEGGQDLGQSRDGSRRDEETRQWQWNRKFEPDEERSQVQPEEMEKERVRQEMERAQRAREREEERDRALQASWEEFMRAERRELRLRQDGQLAKLLGDALPGEPSAALKHLASEDQRQAKEGLVALMSNGKIVYKPLEELCVSDMPARSAANRLRMTWLKERQDGWLVSGRD